MIQDEILWLNVPMDNVIAMQVFERQEETNYEELFILFSKSE